jgi:hypothetical protein
MVLDGQLYTFRLTPTALLMVNYGHHPRRSSGGHNWRPSFLVVGRLTGRGDWMYRKRHITFGSYRLEKSRCPRPLVREGQACSAFFPLSFFRWSP